MGWLLLSLGVMLNSVYYTLWRVLRELPILHATIGMISAAQSSFAVVAVLGTARLLAAFAHPGAAAPGLLNLLPGDWSSPLWTVMACTVPLLLAVPAAAGAFWLPLRRTRDDFGRDHYNAMIPWCATGALPGRRPFWKARAFCSGSSPSCSGRWCGAAPCPCGTSRPLRRPCSSP